MLFTNADIILIFILPDLSVGIHARSNVVYLLKDYMMVGNWHDTSRPKWPTKAMIFLN